MLSDLCSQVVFSLYSETQIRMAITSFYKLFTIETSRIHHVGYSKEIKWTLDRTNASVFVHTHLYVHSQMQTSE